MLNNAKNRGYIGYNFAKKVVPLHPRNEKSHVNRQRPSGNAYRFSRVTADKKQPSFLIDFYDEMKAAHELAGGEKDIAIYLIANENAIPFYEKCGMKKADDVMQYNHIEWTAFTVE